MVWKPLALSAAASAQLPPLLISTSFLKNGYTIHLTDLTHIWFEKLSRSDIVSRSKEEATSIDPSNGDQLVIFLDKLDSALGNGAAQNKDTSLALTIESADTGRPAFILNVTVQLPGGLAPLEWPIRLSAAPQALLTSQLIIPLMNAQNTRVQEVESLIRVVQEKDHVIQKIADKLEATNIDFGELFPHAARKPGRKLSLKEAGTKVKALGQFDLAGWRKDVVNSEVSQDTAELISKVFAADTGIEGSRNDFEESETWWDTMRGITISLATGKFFTNGHRKAPKPKSVPVETAPSPPPQRKPSVEDTFQVQEVSKARDTTPIPKTTNGDSSTEDEQSPAKSPTPPKRSTSPIPTRPKKRGLGRIGGKKAPPPEPEPEPEKEVEPAPVDRSPTPDPPKPRRRLGQIGGTKKQPEPSPSPPPSDHTEKDKQLHEQETISPPSSAPAAIPRRKLGQLGGRKRHAEKVEEAAEVISPERVSKEEVKEEIEEEKVEETELEKADRKREELKQAITEKAKIPVKKKRKF